MSYFVTTLPNGDKIPFLQDDSNLNAPPQRLLWNDAGFQAWNAAQPIPATLSNRQKAIQRLRGLTLQQWQDGTTVTATQKDAIAFYILQDALQDEIV